MKQVDSGYRCLWDEEGAPHPGVSNCSAEGRSFDVVIVGGGFTGLWTALYLAESEPSLAIAILEKERIGHGASGRNGGWCSALLPMSLRSLERSHGRRAAVDMQVAMFEAVDLIGAETRRLGIDCDFATGGTLEMARSVPQLERARARVSNARSFGFGEEHLRLLGASETTEITRATRVLGGVFDPHCAAVNPGKLVRGLRRAVVELGVEVHENTEVLSIEPGRVCTTTGFVNAGRIVRATEGFSASIRGLRRHTLPIHSLMIATEPLDDRILDEIGLSRRQTFNDGRHMIVYGQRTADGRIAFGGRGAPYHFGSRVKPEYSTSADVAKRLRETLVDMYPVLRDSRVTHHWGGPLGASRDWTCSVRYDPSTGLASAGGYVGDGVATTNLAGRTLAALIAETDSDITQLPWVGHVSRKWEPEPIRWIAVNSLTRLARLADSMEERTGRDPKLVSWLIDTVSGG